MAGQRKEGIYGPVKAFSYLTGAEQNAPNNALRREGGQYGSSDNIARARVTDDYGSQVSNLNRNSLYPPGRESGQSDYYRDSNYPGYRSSYAQETDSHLGYNPQGQDAGRYGDYSNSGYDDSPVGSRRSEYQDRGRGGNSGERHPMSPEGHPSLFDNFILKGPGKGNSDPAPQEEPRPDRSSGGSGSRVPLQDLFQDPNPGRARREERNTKYSSQASSTAGLISPDRSSSSASDFNRPRYEQYVGRSNGPTTNDLRSNKSDAPYNYDRKLPRTDPTPSSFIFNEPEVETRPQHYQQNHKKEPKSKDTEFFPQIQDNAFTNSSPTKIRPSTQEGDFNTLMRNGPEDYEKKKRRSLICTAVAVCIVVALICLGAGFVAGWFGYKETRGGPENLLNSTISTPLPSSSTTTTATTSLSNIISTMDAGNSTV